MNHNEIFGGKPTISKYRFSPSEIPSNAIFIIYVPPCVAARSERRPHASSVVVQAFRCPEMKTSDSDADSNSHSLTLRGSADLVTEFFAYSVNALLYQRGIYPPETFTRVSKYGMTMMVSTDEKVQQYLASVLEQMTIWLSRAELDRVAVVISSVSTSTVLERWVFNVRASVDQENNPVSPDHHGSGDKNAAPFNQRQVISEIQALVRQITASVTFLPLLDEPCSFDMLIYTKKDAETPAQWEESGPRIIPNNSQVQLRSFSTAFHNVDACVAYATENE